MKKFVFTNEKINKNVHLTSEEMANILHDFKSKTWILQASDETLYFAIKNNYSIKQFLFENCEYSND